MIGRVTTQSGHSVTPAPEYNIAQALIQTGATSWQPSEGAAINGTTLDLLRMFSMTSGNGLIERMPLRSRTITRLLVAATAPPVKSVGVGGFTEAPAEGRTLPGASWSQLGRHCPALNCVFNDVFTIRSSALGCTWQVGVGRVKQLSLVSLSVQADVLVAVEARRVKWRRQSLERACPRPLPIMHFLLQL